MAKHDVIKIGYPGAEISVNHYLGKRKDGGYYVKPETKAWKEEFQWLLKRCHLEDYELPLEVTCSGYFKDERSAPDLSNLSKVVMDSIEELTGINDKNMRWHDGQRVLLAHIKAEDPYLLINISETTTTLAPEATKSKSDGDKVLGKGLSIPKRKYAKKSNKKSIG